MVRPAVTLPENLCPVGGQGQITRPRHMCHGVHSSCTRSSSSAWHCEVLWASDELLMCSLQPSISQEQSQV